LHDGLYALAVTFMAVWPKTADQRYITDMPCAGIAQIVSPRLSALEGNSPPFAEFDTDGPPIEAVAGFDNPIDDPLHVVREQAKSWRNARNNSTDVLPHEKASRRSHAHLAAKRLLLPIA